MEEKKKIKRGNPSLLQPVRSKEEASERGRAGGIRSGEVRKEKKLLSSYYADFIAKANGVDSKTDINAVIADVLSRGDSASVSMMKEIREATEGSKVEHSGSLGITIIDDIK